MSTYDGVKRLISHRLHDWRMGRIIMIMMTLMIRIIMIMLMIRIIMIMLMIRIIMIMMMIRIIMITSKTREEHLRASARDTADTRTVCLGGRLPRLPRRPSVLHSCT